MSPPKKTTPAKTKTTTPKQDSLSKKMTLTESKSVKESLNKYFESDIPGDFSVIPEETRLVYLLRTPKKYIKKRAISGKQFPYIDHYYAEKSLNFVFNFSWSYELTEQKFVEYKEGTKQVAEAQVIMRFKATYRGVEITRDIASGHKYYSNPATTRMDAMKSAISKGITVFARQFGIGADIKDAEEKAYRDLDDVIINYEEQEADLSGFEKADEESGKKEKEESEVEDAEVVSDKEEKKSEEPEQKEEEKTEDKNEEGKKDERKVVEEFFIEEEVFSKHGDELRGFVEAYQSDIRIGQTTNEKGKIVAIACLTEKAVEVFGKLWHQITTKLEPKEGGSSLLSLFEKGDKKEEAGSPKEEEQSEEEAKKEILLQTIEDDLKERGIDKNDNMGTMLVSVNTGKDSWEDCTMDDLLKIQKALSTMKEKKEKREGKKVSTPKKEEPKEEKKADDEKTKKFKAFQACRSELKLDDTTYRVFVRKLSQGRTNTSKDLKEEELVEGIRLMKLDLESRGK